MALNFNKIMLSGRITAAPELKRTPSDISVTQFTIAVNRRFTKQGEQAQADFIDIVCWRQQAEFVTKYFTKGSPIFVIGALQTRTWKDNEGKTRKTFEVVADEVMFVESRSQNGGQGSSQGGNFYDNQRIDSVPSGFDGGFDFDSAGGDFTPLSSEDDLPF